MWKALDSRWVSRAGNLAFLLGALQGAARVLMGLSLANVLTVVLIVAGVALMAIPYLSRLRSAQPATRPEAADSHAAKGRVYGNAAIRQAISEVAEDEDRQSITAEFVTMIEEGKRLRDREFTGELTWSDVDPWWRGIMGFTAAVLGDAERQRLIEIEPAGTEPRDRIEVVIGWLQKHRDHPGGWTPQLRGDALAAALQERRRATQGTLADLLDNMIREGMELVTELSVPVQPEETANGWKIEGGGPSAEQQEKADAFRQRAGELLEQRNPALLADYRDGCNDYIRRASEGSEASDPSADSRSDAEKMLALASAERRTAAWEVEVCLEGLARARKAI